MMKVLKLQSWMKDYGEGHQGCFKHEMHRTQYERQAPYFLKSYSPDGMLDFPDGWYLQSKKNCYFVVNKHVYKCNPAMFRHELDKIEAQEKVGSPAAVLALAELEKRVHGKVSEKTQRLVRAVYWHFDGIRMRKSSVRNLKRLRELRKQKGL